MKLLWKYTVFFITVFSSNLALHNISFAQDPITQQLIDQNTQLIYEIDGAIPYFESEVQKIEQRKQILISYCQNGYTSACNEYNWIIQQQNIMQQRVSQDQRNMWRNYVDSLSD